MAVVWNQAMYERAYAVRDRNPASPTHGERFSYGRRFAQLAASPLNDQLTLYLQRVDRLTAAFAIRAADRILVVGCGLGFLVEAFHDRGFPNVWGIDDSTHVAQLRATETREDVDFIEDDVRGGRRVRNALRRRTGAAKFDWVLTESVLEGYEDAELQTIFDATGKFLAAPGGLDRVVHLVVTTPSGRSLDDFNWKTLAEWKAMRPAHSFIAAQTGGAL